MIIYISFLIFIILLGFLFFHNGVTEERKNKYLIIIFFICFIIMGFRAESVGTDTYLYVNMFEKYSELSFSEIIKNSDASIVYALYNKIISLLSNERSTIILFNSFIISFLTMLFIKNNSKNPVYSSLLFLNFYHFFNAMNISRQFIAIMLVANAFYYLKNKDKFKYILLVITATLFHATAIVSALLIPFLYIKKNKQNIIYFLIITIIIIASFNTIFLNFSNLFAHYTLYLKNNLLYETGQNKKVIITLIYLLIEFILIYLINLKKTSIEDKEKFKLYLLYNSLSIIIGIAALKIMLLSRVEIYFSILAIIYIPDIISYFNKKAFYYYAFLLIMLIPMIVQLKNNNSEVLPYLFR